ncbi:cysteine hydrolase family protein [Alkalihalobacillus sp. AL-G]|uniref:cysteine hydrolase family protein n=1 Tax=Alkalihalobacillus sp. AL-G TaxID=2926399 RepID=UPI00272C7F2D|nr:isochorismatase family cysteine hydrolase [Alkalihalobacillus sp. AL-G]WLD91528.1 cysteine hydrolase [Alkalihalobacillus sp. AL-G]
MKALIVIDYTNDFVADDGRLTCGEAGQSIESRITELTDSFISNDDYVVFAVDVHDKDDTYHPEYTLFPPHNIRGTTGRKQFGSLNTCYQSSKEKIYWMDKTRYSAFAGTDLELKLRERGISELHLVGVCTDICVLHTAVDGYNKGFKLVIHEDAVQSFNPAGHDWALDHFNNTLGAKVVKANEDPNDS